VLFTQGARATDFPMESGIVACQAAFRRLTGVLPDVAKGGVRQRGVIRNWPAGGKNAAKNLRGPKPAVQGSRMARDLLENDETAAFKAPSLPVQSRALGSTA
jgi:hypothetical protein